MNNNLAEIKTVLTTLRAHGVDHLAEVMNRELRPTSVGFGSKSEKAYIGSHER